MNPESYRYRSYSNDIIPSYVVLKSKEQYEAELIKVRAKISELQIKEQSILENIQRYSNRFSKGTY